MASIPTYEELPEVGADRHAWDVWGRDDRLGTLNFIGAEQVLAATRLVTDGQVFPLSLPLNQPNPPLFSREAFEHTVLSPNRNTRDDKIDKFYPQASSQWDSLRHIRYGQHGFYGGREDAAAETDLGIDAYAERGIAGRGVLVDVERWRRAQGRPLDMQSDDRITAQDLDGALAAQGVDPEEGDILLLRTGWLGWYRSLTSQEVEAVGARPTTPGLEGTAAMAAWLWDHRVAAIASDNPALERTPGEPRDEGYLHRRVLPALGLAIGELWDLEPLADACAQDGRYVFLLASAPLNLPGGVGSPPNALAIR